MFRRASSKFVAAGLSVFLTVPVLSACGNTASHHGASAASTTTTLAAPDLPPGFVALGNAAPTTPHVLEVRQATREELAGLQPAPFPRSQVEVITQTIVNEPVKSVARHLLVSTSTLRPSATIVVAAGALAKTTHDVLFILQGPSYRAMRLVEARFGAAAGVVTLPSAMAPGTWALAAQDLSQVRSGPGHVLTGTVLVDLGIFNVGNG